MTKIRQKRLNKKQIEIKQQLIFQLEKLAKEFMPQFDDIFVCDAGFYGFKCILGRFTIDKEGLVNILAIYGFSGTESGGRKAHASVKYIMEYDFLTFADIRKMFAERNYITIDEDAKIEINYGPIEYESLEESISKIKLWLTTGIIGEYPKKDEKNHLYHSAEEYRENIRATAYFISKFPDLWYK